MPEVILHPAARERLADLKHIGECTQVDANAADCRLVETQHGTDRGKDHIHLTLLVDPHDIVKEARYRTLATGADLITYDLMAAACIGQPLESLGAITRAQAGAVLIDAGDPELPPHDLAADDTFPVLKKVAGRSDKSEPKLEAQAGEEAPKKAKDLDWDQVGLFEKVRRIEEVLDDQVRPMLATDGGGVDLVDLKENDLIVQYNGACGSCSSAAGGTLFFIEDTLNSALGTELRVVPQGIEGESFVDI